ncbi:GTP 3',8-cyclase MoaA [Candidatus Bathyarchaeota archaeon]|nr:GTP 3',8-cyclase MoaA [Candidatus Bathyarchaeota archaeon]
MLKDSCGRPLLNLRVAITQRCNLRCEYCHKEGEDRLSNDFADEMSVAEIVRIVRIAAGLGISHVKLTGGEPLMRKDILEIVKNIAAIRGLADLSMTTNGVMLSSLARELHASGLKRVNISLPTLNGEVYKKLTGGRVGDVWEGIKAAVDAGFNPVKLNMVILKNMNDSDVLEMVDFARNTGTILQLIELEPINIGKPYYSEYHKGLDEYEVMLRQKALKVETRRFMQSRHIYHLSDVTVEVVHPIENTDFCLRCTRLRVTSDGKLKSCLMRSDNLVDILTPMRNGASDKELVELFELVNRRRHPYYNKN